MYFTHFGPLVAAAEDFAAKCHITQTRKYTGVPYMEHLRRVARKVCELDGAKPVHIAAALLHDVVEDCPGITIQMLSDKFGVDVAALVRELTNQSKATGGPRAERKKIDRERLANASKWAKKIKLIDRADNLWEMDGASDDFKTLYANESLLLLEDCLRGVDARLETDLVFLIHRRLGVVPDSV